MKQKIFQIGFNKCATKSLTQLIRQAEGILPRQVHHYREGVIASHIHSDVNNNVKPLSRYPNLHEIVAFTDMENIYKTNGGLPIFGYEYFSDLYNAYPNSKFILNIRNLDDWIASRKRHGAGSYLKRFMKLTLKTEKEVTEDWIRHFHIHVENVINFFDKNDKKSLLVYDIDKDSHKLVVDFLSDILKFSNTTQMPWVDKTQ